jgi:alpha-tubulin suppressor-like RCC1 family protein
MTFASFARFAGIRRLSNFVPVLFVVCFSAALDVPRAHGQTSASSGAVALTSGTAPVTITSPITITSPGVYYLTANVVCSGTSTTGIVVSANNVTLDLNGHSISTAASGAAYNPAVNNVGISASNCTNIAIRHGTISGFLYGILIASSANSHGIIDDTYSYGHVIEDVNFSNNTVLGIQLQGGDSVIRRCQISNTGGSTIQGGGNSFGLLIYGPSNRVLDCDISGVFDNNPGTSGYGIVFGANAVNCFAWNNRLSGTFNGIYYNSTASGKYAKNLAGLYVGKQFQGGTDAGGNIIDTNGDGVDDNWELLYFGTLNVNLSALAPSGDGLTNLQAYQQGVSPIDYYNGIAPELQMVAGSNQYGISGSALLTSLVTLVTITATNAPATNAPVAYSVTGPSLVGATAVGPWAQLCTVRTDSLGHATVYCMSIANTPNTVPISTIQATAGTAAPVSFVETALSVPPPVAAGLNHSLAIDEFGDVWAWGDNTFGQRGNNSSYTIGGIPNLVTGVNAVGTLNGVVAVAAGVGHSLALLSPSDGGGVLAWGYNNSGQLGNGTTNPSSAPAPVYTQGTNGPGPALTGVVAIAAGSNHSLALKGDGSVWAWGDNYCGDLGDGTYTMRTLAVQIFAANSGIVAIAAGDGFTVALKSSGSVWTWGTDFEGQLGNAAYFYNLSESPVEVNGPGGTGNLTNVVAVAAGAGGNHALALESNGSVWSWGSNSNGQLGNDTEPNASAYPVQVVGSHAPVGGASDPSAASLGFLGGVTEVAAGENNSLAVSATGVVWAWGNGADGQLGNNTTGNGSAMINSDFPEPVTFAAVNGTSPVIASVSAGGNHCLAEMNYEGVPVFFGWGDDTYGEADGAATPIASNAPLVVAGRLTPVLVKIAADADHDGLDDWQEYLYGSNPLNADTNGDGILDGVAVAAALNPTAPLPALPPDNPNDHTPPVITITSPAVGVTQM